MTILEQLSLHVTIDPNYRGDASLAWSNDILGLLAYMYGAGLDMEQQDSGFHSEARAIVEKILERSIPIVIRNGLENEAQIGGININLNMKDIKERKFIANDGTFQSLTFEYVFIHELIHVVYGLDDCVRDSKGLPYSNPGFDHLGDTDRLAQDILTELGYDQPMRVSYIPSATPNDMQALELKEGVSYSEGNRVDTVVIDVYNSMPDFIDLSRNNEAQSHRSDNSNVLIFGFAGSDFLKGGAGNDYIYGGRDNDLINGGSGNDVFHGGLLGLSFDGDGKDTVSYLLGDDGLLEGAVTVEIGVTQAAESDKMDGHTPIIVSDDGYGTRDRLFSIEVIQLSKNDDTVKIGVFAGELLKNLKEIDGEDGDDTIDFSAFGKAVDIRNGKPMSAGENWNLDLKNFEKYVLTERPDTVYVDDELFNRVLTIDMGNSDWVADFIHNRDVVDYSGVSVSEGLIYDDGKVTRVNGTAGGLTIFNAEKVILTAADDIVKRAAPGTIIETGDGKDEIYAQGGNVAISDLSYEDRITMMGFLEVLGGSRNVTSNSIFASNWGGLFKFAVNPEGELLISSPVFGDMWVLNYGSTAPYGEKAGAIYLYEFEMEVMRLLDYVPSNKTVLGTWELWGILLKTMFGVIAWQGLDPLVLDLDGDGIELSARSSISPRFDIDGDLYAERTGWVKSDDGILVRDRNDNGVIDDVSEMFGNSSTGGFAMLARLDRNHDGKVDAADDEGFADIAFGDHFADLRVWRDLNQDGHTDAGELFTLAELGIVSIGVTGEDASQKVNGNDIVKTGSFTREDGSTGTVGEVILKVDNINTVYTGPKIEISAAAARLPDLKAQGTLVSLREAASLSPDAAAAIAAALPTLTSLNIAELRQQATPILQAWAQGSPLGDDDGDPSTSPDKLQPHEDLHVLIRTADTGRQSVEDVAFRMTAQIVNAAGQLETITYWALASGRGVKDADGNEIAYPTLDELLGQAPGANRQWSTISGTLLGVAERMIGESLPLDEIPVGTRDIHQFMDLANTLLATIDSAVVRVAVQGGPLAHYFESLSFDAASNRFTSATGEELAPVYEAILTEAKAGHLGTAWLTQWRPILDIVVGDFVRQGGEGLLNTFGFIAQNVVHALETVQPGLSFAEVAKAFGVRADMIHTGAGLVAGSNEADILYADSANFTLRGSEGADEYIVGRAIGHSVIEDVEAPLQGSYDILRLVACTG